MPEIAEFEIIGKTDQAVKNVGKLNDKIKKTEKTTKKAKDELSGMAQIGNAAVGQLDKMTGGLASKFVAVGKAAKLSGKAMKTALISSGIGLVVVALALIVEYWDEISSLVDGVSGEQAKQLQATEDTLAAQQQQLSATGQMENSLKLQGKTEGQIRDIKQQQTDEIIASTELLLEQQKQTKKSQIEAAERNQKIAAGIIAFLSLPVTILLGAVDALTYGLAKLGIIDEATSLVEDAAMATASFIFDPEDVEKEGDETIAATEEALLKLKNTRDGYLLQDKADQEKLKEDAKKTADEEAEAKKKSIEEIRRLEAEYTLSLIDKQNQEKIAVAKKYDDLIAKAKLYGEDTLVLETARQSELDLINKTYTEKAEQDEKDRLASIKKIQDDHKEITDIEKLEQQQTEALAELTLLKATKDEKLAIEKFYEDAILDVKKKNKEEEKALSAELLQQGLNDAKATFDMVGQLAGKDSKVGKAMAIASATISGIQGTMNAFATANESPITAVFPAYPFIQAGLAGAVALKNIAAIKSIDPSGKGNTGSVPTSSGGGGAAIPPAFNVVGQSDTNQLADAIGGQSQRPSRSYVVSNDVTTSQELERNIIEGASIG
tara:strand:- start:3874 stop:5691 length:1818 start_codon:yes stop_codon:yes gene_type:complete